MSIETPLERRLVPAEVEAVFQGFTPANWQRALILASATSAGLAGWSPQDLLQEAVTKLLEGARTFPAQVPPLVVLKNVMHSIASNERERPAASLIEAGVRVADVEDEADLRPVAHGESLLTPERTVEHRELLAAVDDLVKDDEELQLLVMAWAEGCRGDEAQTLLGWDTKTHDAARKRLMRRVAPLKAEWSSR